MKNTPQILKKNTPHVWAIQRFTDEQIDEISGGDVAPAIVGGMRVFFTGHTVHASLKIGNVETFTSISQKSFSEDYAICLVVSQLIRKFGEEFRNDDFVQALHCNTPRDMFTRFMELGYDLTKVF